MSRFYAQALTAPLGGHDGLPAAKLARVEFRCGNSAESMLAAWGLHYAWGWEEHGREIDSDGYLSDWMAKAQSGTFLQIVGWADKMPVATVELRLLYDAMLHKSTLYGDHAYVRPEYRKAGVMRALVDYCIATAEVMGMTKWLVPVTAGADATAPFLRKVYEDAGFTVSGLTMKREL